MKFLTIGLWVLAAIWLTTNGSAVADRDAADASPVWHLIVDQDSLAPRAELVFNGFAKSGGFPLRELLVRRRIDHSEGGRPSFSVETALLEVAPDGILASSALAFRRSSMVSVNELTGKVTTLAPVDSDETAATALRDSPHSFPVSLDLNGFEEFYRWEESPDGSWCLVHTSRGTRIFTRRSLLPVRRIPDRIYYGSFSRDGSRYAAVATAQDSERWILLSSDGEVLRQGSPGLSSLYHLHLSPDARALTFQRDGIGAGSVVVDLARGTERILPVRFVGTRYYAADGRTMLDLSPGFGLQSFDVADPQHPRALSQRLELEGHSITGAVSADGALIAVEMLEPEDNPHSTLLCVIVFDRRLRRRIVLLRHTSLQGLQFEGRYLFVGTQRHPIPTWIDLTGTSEIRVYDLRSQ